MNDPVQEFWRVLDEVTDSVGLAFDEVAYSVETTLDEAFLEVLELAEPLISACGVLGEALTQSVQPLADGHNACAGCHHYHGQVYGETMLVCAMYPYGPETATCRDWASTWEALGNRLTNSKL